MNLDNRKNKRVVVTIDENSGFCFGVVNAISKAEESLHNVGHLYCLGDIVHNSQEQERLSKLGLEVITHQDLKAIHNEKVLLRAHGEPPETYRIAQQNSNLIIDASCPVVLRLQTKIKQAFEANPDAQIVIYGKIGHAEVNGLVGQTNGKAIVVENEEDAEKLDFTRDIVLFSQTTKSLEGFNGLINFIKKRMQGSASLVFNDTICRQVANRVARIRRFASNFELVFFVSDRKSSNGKVLFEECCKVNNNVHFISSAKDIDVSLLENVKTIGICGATSTPKWLMEDVEKEIYLKTKE